ncbi:unnamed protein product [Vitrella brassicaformis CCMP3155]|uniref:EF-hand domain-containing protein n=2 Tax=Vitrella brassicaformis TaxID=1169539 RepID=A0A0G4EAA8_VITBC|nr:unnamed protein product [Vitrella brassicaformis CCMP3155]|eukprot:CEL92533.1 unnamed protein product [Vitrella brassicaformis CCMP3155]
MFAPQFDMDMVEHVHTECLALPRLERLWYSIKRDLLTQPEADGKISAMTFLRKARRFLLRAPPPSPQRDSHPPRHVSAAEPSSGGQLMSPLSSTGPGPLSATYAPGGGIALRKGERRDSMSGPAVTQEEMLLELLFDRVDRRKQGFLKAIDLVTALILISKADQLTRLRSLFRVFDADDDACLSPDEIFELYFATQRNDLTKDRTALLADILFADELSLQQARRLFEVTMESLTQAAGSITEFVIFDEFAKVFERLPYLIHRLLPGRCSLQWVLNEYRPTGEEVAPVGRALRDDTRHRFKTALRRGNEPLQLDDEQGRGTRIMAAHLQPTQPSPRDTAPMAIKDAAREYYDAAVIMEGLPGRASESSAFITSPKSQRPSSGTHRDDDGVRSPTREQPHTPAAGQPESPASPTESLTLALPPAASPTKGKQAAPTAAAGAGEDTVKSSQKPSAVSRLAATLNVRSGQQSAAGSTAPKALALSKTAPQAIILSKAKAPPAIATDTADGDQKDTVTSPASAAAAPAADGAHGEAADGGAQPSATAAQTEKKRKPRISSKYSIQVASS